MKKNTALDNLMNNDDFMLNMKYDLSEDGGGDWRVKQEREYFNDLRKYTDNINGIRKFVAL